MAVFKKSRYNGSYTFLDRANDRVYLNPIRLPAFQPSKEDFQIQFKEGDRFDLIAHEYYGDADYEWVLMDANPQYNTPFDAKPGEYINVPHPERVMSLDT